MDNENEEVIKPCPFCGEQPKIVLSNDKPRPFYRVTHYCKTNAIKPDVYSISIETNWYQLEQDAIKVWNNRKG
jgi:hypothetical protein